MALQVFLSLASNILYGGGHSLHVALLIFHPIISRINFAAAYSIDIHWFLYWWQWVELWENRWPSSLGLLIVAFLIFSILEATTNRLTHLNICFKSETVKQYCFTIALSLCCTAIQLLKYLNLNLGGVGVIKSIQEVVFRFLT